MIGSHPRFQHNDLEGTPQVESAWMLYNESMTSIKREDPCVVSDGHVRVTFETDEVIADAVLS